MCDIKLYKDQDYESLKKEHDAKNLFVDPEFPANNKSIYHSGKRLTDVEWHRPTVEKTSIFFSKNTMSLFLDGLSKTKI